MPGTLIVEAGGILVQQGLLDYLDLVWFVAAGAILGGEASYALGRLARRMLSARWQPPKSIAYRKAARLFQRHGGFALMPARFLGPLFGLVTLVAALAGLPRRRFMVWNIVSAVLYALVHSGVGVLVGGVASSLGPLVNRVGLAIVLLVLALVLLWGLIARMVRLAPFARSILRSVGAAIRDTPEVRDWSRRHPRLSRFAEGRFDRNQFSGRTATLLCLAAFYLIWVWLGSVFDMLMLDPIVQADMRLANLIHDFWSPDLLRLATHVTALGDAKVIATLIAAAGILTLLRRRPDLLGGLAVAVCGNLGSVAALKRIFDRPRPELAYFVETSGSFPSGHAAISVAFYGFAAFMLWRLRLLRAVSAAFGAAVIAFLIGLSRITLIEHYLSDVINGWLVGAIWLVIGIAFAEWRRAARPRAARIRTPPVTASLRRSGIAAIVALVLIAVWQVANYEKARKISPGPVGDVAFTTLDSLIAAGHLPAQTASLGGAPLEPINVIVLAADEAELATALTRAGWHPAHPPDLVSLLRAAVAVWTNSADPVAPVTPYFWRNAPNDLAFQKPTAEATLRHRHHVRFWRTEFVTETGQRLFVGAASFDDGLDWNLLHHIAPDIDAERATLVADLRAQGAASSVTALRLTQPRLGRSVAGDPWFTDGQAAVITLSRQ